MHLHKQQSNNGEWDIKEKQNKNMTHYFKVRPFKSTSEYWKQRATILLSAF